MVAPTGIEPFLIRKLGKLRQRASTNPLLRGFQSLRFRLFLLLLVTHPSPRRTAHCRATRLRPQGNSGVFSAAQRGKIANRGLRGSTHLVALDGIARCSMFGELTPGAIEAPLHKEIVGRIGYVDRDHDGRRSGYTGAKSRTRQPTPGYAEIDRVDNAAEWRSVLVRGTFERSRSPDHRSRRAHLRTPTNGCRRHGRPRDGLANVRYPLGRGRHRVSHPRYGEVRTLLDRRLKFWPL